MTGHHPFSPKSNIDVPGFKSTRLSFYDISSGITTRPPSPRPPLSPVPLSSAPAPSPAPGRPLRLGKLQKIIIELALRNNGVIVLAEARRVIGGDRRRAYQSLKCLVKRGIFRRIGRGLYQLVSLDIDFHGLSSSLSSNPVVKNYGMKDAKNTPGAFLHTTYSKIFSFSPLNHLAPSRVNSWYLVATIE